MTEPNDLDRLEKLCQEATPGPWQGSVTKNCLGIHIEGANLIFRRIAYLHPIRAYAGPTKEAQANQEFIITSRTALPELISEVKSLRAKLEIAREALEKIVRSYDGWDFEDGNPYSFQIAEQALAKIKEEKK